MRLSFGCRNLAHVTYVSTHGRGFTFIYFVTEEIMKSHVNLLDQFSIP